MKKLVIKLIILLSLLVTIYQCEEREWSNPFGGDLAPEEWSPDSLNVSQKKINEAVLTWSLVNRNIEGYKIFRNFTDTGEPTDTCIVTLAPNVNRYIDENMIPDTFKTYVYSIYAFADEFESLIKIDTIKPTFPAPTNLSYSILNNSLASLRLAWNDNSSGEDGFIISKKYGNFNWSEAIRLNENVTEFVDQIPVGLDVKYRIRAYRDTAYSSFLSGQINIAKSKNILLGGSGSQRLNHVCRSSKLTYVAVGWTNSPDFINTREFQASEHKDNAIIMEMDHNLNLINTASFGGTGNDSFERILAVEDGYIILGFTNSDDFDCKNRNADEFIWVTKLDLDFNIQWSSFLSNGSEYRSLREHRGHSYYENTPIDIGNCEDGSIILTGFKWNNYQSDGWITRLNDSGDQISELVIGGQKNDNLYRMLIFDNDSVLAIGTTESEEVVYDGEQHHGNSDVWLIKMTKEGELAWSKVYGGSGWDEGTNIINWTDYGMDVFGGDVWLPFSRIMIAIGSVSDSINGIPIQEKEDMTLLNLDMDGGDLYLMYGIMGVAFAPTPLSMLPIDNYKGLVLCGNSYDYDPYIGQVFNYNNYWFKRRFDKESYWFGSLNCAIKTFDDNILSVGWYSAQADTDELIGDMCWIINMDNQGNIIE